jgi:segregation and condensation protein A
MGGQLGSCPDAEQPGASTKPGVSASGEPAEQEPEVEAEQEAEAVAGPTASAESTFADEPVLEEAASPVELSVELKEPAIEEPRKKTAGQPAANEGESPEQTASVAEAAPETEPAIEQAAEIDPEPAKIPMELNEPIREQEGEPAASSETAPVAQPASEEDAGDLAAVPAETFVAESAAVAIAAEAPAAEAAAEPAVEDVAIPAQEPAPAAPQKPFIKLESRDNEADLSPFSVVVSQVYDGPLDLLLDLIRKQDIDIYDIPIARITAQFLAYVNQLKATDVDVAGEFIYTASLLIHIKSKMLLPRAPAGPDDAAEDPRRELVERLLEHERFKSAAQMLQQKQMLEAATWTNPGLREFQDDAGAEPEIAADTVDLVRVFRDILERARNRPVINVEEDSVTVGQMIQFLSRRLTMEDKPVALRRLLSHTRSERALIAMFLALLELVRLQAILLRQDRAFSEIFIKKHTGFESVMNDGLANARDDWR